VLEAWDEGSETGVAGVSNWSQRQAGVAWSAPGALPPSSAVSPVTFLAPDQTSTAYAVALPASLVQAWLDDPASNFGVVLRLAAGNDDVIFDSVESATATHRPELSVTYLP
jgi:hypothetical protein